MSAILEPARVEDRCLKTWYFTFGKGSTLSKNYVKLENMTWDKARGLMNNEYGIHWSYQYESNAFSGLVELHGLTEVLIGTPIHFGEME